MMGKQLHAPDGWTHLKKGKTYYLLQNSAHSDYVFLVDFVVKGNKKEQAELIQIKRFEFETGIEAGAIRKCDTQYTLPPWLRKFEGQDLNSSELKKSYTPVKNQTQRINDRAKIIEHAVQDFDSIMRAENPVVEINKYARNAQPVQNESRFRHWLLTFMCFGRNKAVLLPSFHNAGKWSRDERAKVKQGAPSLAYGKKYGFRMTQVMRETCIEGFKKHAENSKFLRTVYVEVLRKEFGCKIVERSRSDIEIYAQGSYPTFDQFRYIVDKAIGSEVRQKILYGEARHRNKKAPSKGRFSQELANLYEKIYMDAYQIDARPKGYLENNVLPALYGVVGVDGLSGMPLGIGFSFGSERSHGYRMLLFSMSVEKMRFCSLFGVDIEAHEWPCHGLPSHILLDRGPGARKNLVENVEKQFVIRQLAPSWSGQSKAPVETTHPKQLKLEGKPTHQVANLTPVQLVVAEILRVLEYVKSANMADRLDPLPDFIDVYPTPQGIWGHFDQRYRNDAIQVRFEDAVRSFLTKVEFTIKEDGIYLYGRLFNCDDLRETGIFSRGNTKVEGYILDLCVRYVWVEWEGRLIEAKALHRIRGLDEDLYLSIEELKQFESALAQKKSNLRVQKIHVKLQTRERFYKTTGLEFDSIVRRKTGRVVKSKMSQQEAAEVFSSRNIEQVGTR